MDREARIHFMTLGMLRSARAHMDDIDPLMFAEALQRTVTALVGWTACNGGAVPPAWTIKGKAAPLIRATCQVTLTYTPRPQPLPECWRHPHLACPGECQYLAPLHVCLNDIAATPPSGRTH
jgi:hypothetical protein